MSTIRTFDVCIVGSGASGAICAWELAQRGLSVIVVEQGTHVPAGSLLDEALPADQPAFARTPEGRWVREGLPWTACAVGGGTRFYGGVSFRFRAADFDARPYVATDALDPRWPFGYDTLRPFYDRVERLLPIARTSETDPTEPDSPPPHMPAHPYTRSGDLIAAAGDKLGLRAFPTPTAVNSIAGPGGSGVCDGSSPCSGRSCPVGAKADVYERLLAPLLRQQRIVLMTRTRAVRLHEAAPGRITSLEVLDLDRRRRATVRAHTYILAANAVQTAAILLNSSSRHSPDGIGNNTGMVGRGLCLRACEYVSGELEEEGRDDSGRYSSVSFTDLYLDHNAPAGMGGIIIEANRAAHHRTTSTRRVLRVESLVADQPMKRNRVRLSKSHDRFGIPHVVLDYLIHPLDRQRLDYLRHWMRQILITAGVTHPYTEPLDFTLGRAHLHGTCRSGTDPRDSVCTPDGRIHDIDNVYVADGSLMPYPGGVNPTFTIQANALRIATIIATQFR